jgi:beta-galactosidase
VNAYTANVSIKYSLPDIGSHETISYTIFSSGDILVDVALDTGAMKLPELMRFGLNMRLAGDLQHVSWYGRGPYENYRDRKAASFVGFYESSVEEQYTPYVRPQENGYKTDVRWLTLTNEKNSGLLFCGAPRVCFSALPYTYDDLKGFKHGGKHLNDLEKKDFVDLNLDYGQCGVGGDDSWGARPMDAYTLPAKNYNYSFRIRPFNGKDDLPHLVRQQLLIR